MCVCSACTHSKTVGHIFEGEVEAWALTLNIVTCNVQSVMKTDDKDSARPVLMIVHGGSNTFVQL